jgi:DNA polymerase III delta prime subunit
MLNIHNSIKEKLDYFHSIRKIPNIIFHGPSGSGKRTILNDFINKIYDNDSNRIKDFVMNVNCAHGKGIKFIREELKFFAKTHINSNGGDVFKSIILLNADKLTIDAQSALRRCIELFSYNTRFFIIVENKYKILKPILSRFCEIYISEPFINGKVVNLYKYNIKNNDNYLNYKNNRLLKLKKELTTMCNNETYKMDEKTIMLFSDKLYEKGYTGLDIIKLIENQNYLSKYITNEKRYELLFAFNKFRKELRNEKILMFIIIHFLFLDKEICLENFSFI